MRKDEAISRGLRFFFTGRPCSNGHIAHRYVRSSQCVECVSEAAVKRHALSRQKERMSVDGAGGDCYVIVSLKVHRDDEEAVIAYVTALNLHRSS